VGEVITVVRVPAGGGDPVVRYEYTVPGTPPRRVDVCNSVPRPTVGAGDRSKLLVHDVEKKRIKMRRCTTRSQRDHVRARPPVQKTASRMARRVVDPEQRDDPAAQHPVMDAYALLAGSESANSPRIGSHTIVVACDRRVRWDHALHVGVRRLEDVAADPCARPSAQQRCAHGPGVEASSEQQGRAN
jgi:hypothetical protein